MEVYHQLLLEGHLLLESRLAALLSSIALSSGREPADTAAQLSSQLEAENYRKLLRKSASLLADVRSPHAPHAPHTLVAHTAHNTTHMPHSCVRSTTLVPASGSARAICLRSRTALSRTCWQRLWAKRPPRSRWSPTSTPCSSTPTSAKAFSLTRWPIR